MKHMTSLLLGLVVGLCCVSVSLAVCPSGCLCLGGQVSCSANQVTAIPQVQGNITVLNMDENAFSNPVISRSNFTGLTGLVELSMSGCRIQTIQANTFLELTKLVYLDLSMNNLRAISPQAFTNLNLDYLFLGENPSLILPSSGFIGMSTGVLDLKKCQLAEVLPSFFTPLRSKLRKLYLNGNKFTRFPSAMISVFSDLETLKIEENPLVCDCNSRWLKQFYDQNRNIIGSTSDGTDGDPRCSAPMSVAGEFFSRLSVMDFLCEKPTINSEITLNKDKGVLRCISKGHPTPRLSWHKPSGVIEITYPLPNNDVTEAEIEVLSSEPQIHGSYRCVASNEAGNVSLSVNVTWPFLIAPANSVPCTDTEATTAQEVVLSNNEPVEAPEEEDTDVFKKNYFTIIDMIIGVFGTFAGTLIITVVVLHVCVYRKRKPSSQYSTPSQSEYGASSLKNEVYPTTSQSMQIHTMQNTQHLQSRPLPNKPCHKTYDENHYMSTQLDESDDLMRLGQHNAALVSSHSPPPCEACRTLNAHHRHSQVV